MRSTPLFYLAALTPILSRASPISTPGEADSLEKRTGNIGNFANYLPDCTEDPSNAVGPSSYTDGSGVYVSSSCDNGLTSLAVKRYHCWYGHLMLFH